MISTHPLILMPPEQARAQLLHILKQRSFAHRPVILSSGQASDYYIDCKQTSLNATGSLLIGRLLFERIQQGAHVEAAGGLTLGADPLATALSLFSALAGSPIDAFIVRQQPKGHGTQQWLEGHRNIPAGAPVAILEDVTTTGSSALKAIERVEHEGFVVKRVITLVDRLEGAADRLRDAGYTLEALITREDLFQAQ